MPTASDAEMSRTRLNSVSTQLDSIRASCAAAVSRWIRKMVKGATSAVRTVRPQKRFGAAQTKAFTTGTILATPVKATPRPGNGAARLKPPELGPRIWAAGFGPLYFGLSNLEYTGIGPRRRS